MRRVVFLQRLAFVVTLLTAAAALYLVFGWRAG